MQGKERREFQRLHLVPPVSATLGATGVTIVEIGVLGAGIAHDASLAKTYDDLRFAYNGDTIALKCEVVRTTEDEGRMHSGLRFLAAIGESGDRLRAMLAQLVIAEFATRRPNAENTFNATTIDGDKTVRGVDAQFLCYRLEHGVWTRRRIFLPEQPAVGFTVARTEDSEEIQRLCQVYQASDEEGRRLIRLFAELSVSDVLEIPPRA
ncbi:MAG TPA: PilZ domain-containing protein [Thermoanaerobaculia bacterium]